MKIRWRAFPLHPHTPAEGLLLEDLFRTTPAKIDLMVKKLRDTARSLNLPFGERKKTYNSRLAQELGLWAEEAGNGDTFHQAAFRAYFAEGLNIAKKENLLHLVERVGLPVEDAREVLDSRSHREAVDRDWNRSRMLGVNAVPTFIMNGKRVVGAQDYQSLARFVSANGALEA